MSETSTASTDIATMATTDTSAPEAAATAAAATDSGTASTASTDSQAATANAQADAKASADAKAAEDAKNAAPAEYKFTAPEGTSLDAAVITEFSAVAKELGLSQESAQKIVDKLSPVMAARQAEAFSAQLAEARQAWATSTKADKEIGGDRFDEHMGIAKKAASAFGNDALAALLEKSGFGDHPEVIRFFYKVGKAMSPDSFMPSVTGISGKANSSGGGTQEVANQLYQ